MIAIAPKAPTATDLPDVITKTTVINPTIGRVTMIYVRFYDCFLNNVTNGTLIVSDFVDGKQTVKHTFKCLAPINRDDLVAYLRKFDNNELSTKDHIDFFQPYGSF